MHCISGRLSLSLSYYIKSLRLQCFFPLPNDCLLAHQSISEVDLTFGGTAKAITTEEGYIQGGKQSLLSSCVLYQLFCQYGMDHKLAKLQFDLLLVRLSINCSCSRISFCYEIS